MQDAPSAAAMAGRPLHSPIRLARAYGELFLSAATRALLHGDFDTALALVNAGLQLVPEFFSLPVRDHLAELRLMIRLHRPVPQMIHGEVVLISPGAVMGPEVIFP